METFFPYYVLIHHSKYVYVQVMHISELLEL